MKKRKLILSIIVIILILIVVLVIYAKKKGYYIPYYFTNRFSGKSITRDNNIFNFDNVYEVELNKSKSYVFENECKVAVKINNFSQDNVYTMDYSVDNREIKKELLMNSFQECNILIPEEGKHNIKIDLKYNDEIIGNINQDIYIVQKYSKQFLDELENKGTLSHFRKSGDYEDYNISVEMTKNLGAQFLRMDFRWGEIEDKSGNFDFEYYDKVMEETKDLNIVAVI